MVRIESQETLRAELQGLLSKGFLQASGALERRGVEVDHTFYLPKENMQLGQLAAGADEDADAEEAQRAPVRSGAGTAAGAPGGAGAGVVQELQQQLQRMQQQSEQLHEALDAVRRRLDRLERELGIG